MPPTLAVIDDPALALCAADDKPVDDVDDVAELIEEGDGLMVPVTEPVDVSSRTVLVPPTDDDSVA